MRVAQALRERLEASLAPTLIDLEDESYKHAGHSGARESGESHFRLTVVAAAFAGQSRVQRQRLVYAAAGDLMRTDIHALSIAALTPDEAAAA